MDFHSGDIYNFKELQYGHELQLMVEVKDKERGLVSFARRDSPYERLTVAQNGEVSFKDSNSKGSIFGLLNSELGYQLYSYSTKMYVGLNELGGLTSVNSLFQNEISCIFQVQIANSREFLVSKPHISMLSPWQIQRFKNEGFLVIPQILSQSVTSACVKRLNHFLGVPGMITAGGAQLGLGKLGGKASNCDEIKSLLSPSVLNIVENLFGGKGMCDVNNLSAQIAFRFPEYKECSRIPWHTDDLRRGDVHGFSLLLGVCLSNVLHSYSGNLCVWPGSHTIIHKCLDRNSHHGAIDLEALAFEYQDNEFNSMHLKTDKLFHDNEPQHLPNIGDPYHVICNTGDIVILHPCLAHAGAPNNSEEIRRMVYFRLKRRCGDEIKGIGATELKDFEVAYLENMWCDFPGL